MIPFPNKKYQIIYADPPWKFIGWNVNKSGKKSPSQHYECQDLNCANFVHHMVQKKLCTGGLN